ncbi:MAG: hypothetical protein MUF13_03535 [Akkermansiaceae bacterium]|nr:hypothetical protein [Akkermansiaceae bacterium]
MATILAAALAPAKLSAQSWENAPEWWNFLYESDRHRLERGCTGVLGTGNQFALSFSLEVPLSSESFDFKLVS